MLVAEKMAGFNEHVIMEADHESLQKCNTCRACFTSIEKVKGKSLAFEMKSKFPNTYLFIFNSRALQGRLARFKF